MAFDKMSYDNAYRRQHYDLVQFSVPKGKKALLKEIAENKNLPLSKMIVEALETQYGIDLSK